MIIASRCEEIVSYKCKSCKLGSVLVEIEKHSKFEKIFNVCYFQNFRTASGVKLGMTHTSKSNNWNIYSAEQN